MLLSSSDGDCHPFCYARVLGIFHANIIYTGPGTKDFQSWQIEFLWVQWFEVIQDHSPLWEQQALDTVRFLPVADKDAFGFVDPANVLRGCHVIPAFGDGWLHPEGASLSHWADDLNDWKWYYINWWVPGWHHLNLDKSNSIILSSFVDRNMLMCYHWGLGIRH